MPQSPLDGVVSHWHKLVENVEADSSEFYDAVEDVLEQKDLFELKSERVEWNEGGILSPRREYLRIHGEHHCFDVCAAPYGEGTFFSMWVTAQKARFVAFHYLMFLVEAIVAWQLGRTLVNGLWSGMGGVGGALLGPLLSLASNFLLIPVAFLLVLGGAAILARGGVYGPERAMLTIPFIGAFYQSTFAPPTYYRLDTMYMFQATVESAVQEVMNDVLSGKGLRKLDEAESVPIDEELADEPSVGADEGLVTADAD